MTMPQEETGGRTAPPDAFDARTFAQTVLDASLNGIYVHDLACGRNIFINAQYTQLTGYTSDDLAGLDGSQFFELFHPDDRSAVTAHMAKLMQGGDTMLEIEYRFRTRDGRWIWCLSRDRVFTRSAEGKVTQFIGTFIDITERKISERLLQDSEKRYRELVQNANSAIIRWQRDGTIVFFNEFAQAFFGYRAEEVLGRHISLIVPQRESNGTDLSSLVGDIVAHPEHYANNINENLCRDGRRVWMNWTNRAILGPDGEVTEILAVGSDITRLRQTAQELRLQQELLQSIFDTIPVILVIWDPTLQRFTLNRHAETVLGWSTAEANEGDFMEKVYPDPAYRAEVIAFMTSLEPGWREWCAATKDGRVVPSDWANVRLSDDTLIGIGVDLRERKQAEAVLRATNEELTEFAYALTHNLKEPLRAVHNYVNFLVEDLGEALEGDPQIYLAGMQKAVAESHRQFTDLETLYRIREHPGDRESFDMEELLDEIGTLFQTSDDREFTSAADWPTFHGGRVFMRQLLIELVGNGFKFNRSEVKRVHIDWRAKADGGVEVRVRDNGIGIDEPYQDQVFRIFQRLHTAREYEGTGIGLAIVKRAAQRMGGTLRVASAPREGSLFSITFPAAMVEETLRISPIPQPR